MIQIDNTIISDDIFDAHFHCDLAQCKGACCIEGDSGAPLLKEEYDQIKSILPQIWDDLSPAAQQLIAETDIAYIDFDGELVTSIINGRECVFTHFDPDGLCLCAIEKAQREGRINTPKPISCHLYPIRLRQHADFIAVNYDRWSICRPAQRLGRTQGTPLYRFLKAPLIRRFGHQWYQQLEAAAEMRKAQEL